MQSSLPSPLRPVLKLNCNNRLFRHLHDYDTLKMRTLTLYSLLYNNNKLFAYRNMVHETLILYQLLEDANKV